jgi:hypothetical protein
LTIGHAGEVMSAPGNTLRPVSAHVVVLGNEKGGSGKSLYRELFPRGLTALDVVEDNEPGTAPSLTHSDVR